MLYRTIVADPPWPYRSTDGGMLRSSAAHRPNSGGGGRAMGVGVVRRYLTASMADLEALPVAGLAEADAHLYLWTTNAFMVEAHKLARAWGFEQKTILTWGKIQRTGAEIRPSMKVGYYFRGATEHVLFCVRGSLPIIGTWPTLFLWPRVAEHSAKPEHFYDLVEQASPAPRLELFARRHRLGWDVWGDESANTATLTACQT